MRRDLLVTMAAFVPCLMLAACGDESVAPTTGDPMPDPTQDPVQSLPQPLAHAMTPYDAAVGDTLTILGENFVRPPFGRSTVHLLGTFTDSLGAVQDVDFEVEPDFINTSVLRMPLTGDAPPSGLGHDTGHFNGSITVNNLSMDGAEAKPSEPAPAELEVLPSLVFDILRPVDEGCGSKVTRTLEGKELEISVRATGLAAANQLRPLRFTWLFMKPGSDISLLDAFALADDVEVPGQHRQDSERVAIVTDVVTAGNSSTLRDMSTFAVPGEAASYIASIFVRAQDADGYELEGRREFEVRREVTVTYDGNQRPVRTFDPTIVSGCLPGGPRGANVTYSENESESRSRSYNVGANIKVGIGIKKIVDIGFGFNVGGSVSSSESVGSSLNLSGSLLPGQFGVFYRQTTQLSRIGRVFENNACGGIEDVGNVTVTDWAWAPDLALSSELSCPPIPPSNLPPGQVFETP